jgi:hypothetical protein
MKGLALHFFIDEFYAVCRKKEETGELLCLELFHRFFD